ncbi:MAG: response regulator [Opitutaceae bacterium]|nr:response regulator [Opitutaceae bacterium]
MKILVADDDQASRRLVAAFLRRADHEVVDVESGEAAIEKMIEPDPPAITIIDWVMPGMSGPDVVSKLRDMALRHRPYVILLSAKNDKASIAEGLDAGADDFLTKPFNPLEMLARVRVAERTLQVQRELQQHIDDLEALAQRYNLLGELIGGPRGTRGERPAAVAPAAASPRPAVAIGSTRLRPDEIDALAQRALAEVGLGEVHTVAYDAGMPKASAPIVLAWSGMVLAGEKCWIDLLLQVDEAGAQALHAAALHRRPTSEREARRFLAEVHTIVTSAFRGALQARGADILSPGLSRAVERHPGAPALPLPDDTVHRAFGVEGTTLTLVIARSACAIQYKDPRDLATGQIVATDFPPPEIDAIPLVTRGSVINERFIGKLVAYAQREGARLGVPVFAPSMLSARV